MRHLPALIGLLGTLFLAGCGGGGDESGGTTAPTSEACAEVGAPDARDSTGNEAPGEPLPPDATYRLTFDTSCGSFTVTLDPETAPNTTASLVALTGAGYFDDTIIHRVVPGFVIQGGDPTQTGSGGPGYSTVDVPPSSAAYTKGVVAMAKTGAEPAGTAGSQFFVVTAADAGLPPEYAIVGEVTDGMDTVERIDALGVADGPPSQTVVVESVKVAEG